MHNKDFGDMIMLAKEKLLQSKQVIQRQKSRNKNNKRGFNVIRPKLGLCPRGENLREFY